MAKKRKKPTRNSRVIDLMKERAMAGDLAGAYLLALQSAEESCEGPHCSTCSCNPKADPPIKCELSPCPNGAAFEGYLHKGGRLVLLTVCGQHSVHLEPMNFPLPKGKYTIR